jgi:hypothetical protein
MKISLHSIPVLGVYPVVQSDIWSELPCPPEPPQAGAFLVLTISLPTQPRMYGGEGDLLDDRDNCIDGRTVPIPANCSEEDDDACGGHESEDRLTRGKPASRPDQIQHFASVDREAATKGALEAFEMSHTNPA